ncbi:UDP-2-acetamido-2-deoxy-ribo-hexuluronate aminotransferase [uncultured Gammaproteobacteria bacterium]
MAAAEPPEGGPIPCVDLVAQFIEEKDELLAVIEAVLARGDYVGGAAVAELEHALAAFHGVSDAVCLNSGTDALILAMRALGIGSGDEVITPANSFVASTASIVHIGARPVLVDVVADQNLDPERVARAITPRTRAIMPVHLTGRVADMDPILALAEAHGLAVIEDAAQAVGSSYKGRLAGTIGDVGCFSAHPLKNLNACGDAGFLVTRRSDLAERIRCLRTHGLIDRNTVAEFGVVSRLDTIQAAILLMRLKRLPGVIDRRRNNARLYHARLDPVRAFAPPCRPYEFNSFHTFVIQVDRRDELQAWLNARGIGTAIHYPVPIHLQPAARSLGYGPGDFPVAEAQAGRILTLPVNQSLSPAQIERVAEAVNAFFAWS